MIIFSHNKSLCQIHQPPIQIIKIENGLLFKPQNLSFLKDFVIVFIF